jgi:hypothetical protein
VQVRKDNMEELNERQEYELYIIDLYDEYRRKTENIGISYGEINHIQSRTMPQLKQLEKELLKELNKE